MLGRVLHIGIALLLAAVLAGSACMACAPMKAGGCCHGAGHCQKIASSCQAPAVAVVKAAASAVVAMPVTAIAAMTAAPVHRFAPEAIRPDEDPPDLCLLYSLLRV